MATSDATHDPRAWRVATALAHATGLDWAQWATGASFADPEVQACLADGRSEDFARFRAAVSASQPVPAPWDTEAYLADCRRRGVEPGPLPSLEWTGPDGFGWKVDAYDVCRVRVDFVDEGEASRSSTCRST